MNTQQKFLSGIILGVAVGSAILFLTKTKKGQDFLSDVGDATEDLSDNLKDKFEGFEKEMKSIIKKGKSFIEDLEDKAKDIAGSFK